MTKPNHASKNSNLGAITDMTQLFMLVYEHYFVFLTVLKFLGLLDNRFVLKLLLLQFWSQLNYM